MNTALRRRHLAAGLSAALGFVSAGSHAAVVATVTDCGDANVAGTLRSVLAAVAATDTVIDASACSLITLTQGELSKGLSIEIDGAAVGTTTIDAGHNGRFFRSTNGDEGYNGLRLSSVTVTGGRVYGAGSLGARGGCILGYVVTLTNSVVTDCVASSDQYYATGGAIHANIVALHGSRIANSSARITAGSPTAQGGAAYVSTWLQCYDSSISGNEAYAPESSQGGGVMVRGALTMSGCTVDANTANNGGGILQYSATYGVTISNSTISGNRATLAAGGLKALSSLSLANSTVTNNSSPTCGGVYSNKAIAVESSIVAGNSSADAACVDLVSYETISGSNNLVSVVNTAMPGDTIVANPRLTPLADRGGPTRTHGLSLNSAAIDAGNNGDLLAFDQRGSSRVVNATADIGAFERQADDEALFYGGFD